MTARLDRLAALVRRAAARDRGDELDTAALIALAWDSAAGDCDAGVRAAVDSLDAIGPHAVRQLLNRVADHVGPRRLSTHPADLWFASYVTARHLGDYRGCTQLIAEAGERLPEWTRRALTVAAQGARAGVR